MRGRTPQWWAESAGARWERTHEPCHPPRRRDTATAALTRHNTLRGPRAAGRQAIHAAGPHCTTQAARQSRARQTVCPAFHSDRMLDCSTICENRELETLGLHTWGPRAPSRAEVPSHAPTTHDFTHSFRQILQRSAPGGTGPSRAQQPPWAAPCQPTPPARRRHDARGPRSLAWGALQARQGIRPVGNPAKEPTAHSLSLRGSPTGRCWAAPSFPPSRQPRTLAPPRPQYTARAAPARAGAAALTCSTATSRWWAEWA